MPIKIEACNECPLHIRKTCNMIGTLIGEVQTRPIPALGEEIGECLEALESEEIKFNSLGIQQCIRTNVGCVMAKPSLNILKLISNLSFSLGWLSLPDRL